MADDSGFTAISLVTDELNETPIPETEIHKNDGRRYHQTAKNISSTILTSTSQPSSTTSPAASMTVVTDGTSTMLERDTVVQEEEGENVEKEGTEDVAFSQMVDDCFFAPQPPRKLEDCVFTEMVDDCFFSGIKNPNQKLKKC